MKIIGLDFEAAPSKDYADACEKKKIKINSWNTHHSNVIEVGMYSMETGKIFTEIIKTDIKLNDWHKNNTPHLNEITINNGKDKCEVAGMMTKFLKQECKKGCTIATYGASDYTWFMKMYENCQDKMKGLNISKHDLYQIYKPYFFGTNIRFFDAYDANLKYNRLSQGNSLKSVFKKVFPNDDFFNHRASDDAKAVAMVTDKIFSKYI